MEVKRVSQQEWMKISSEAHELCFNERRDPSFERIDFALVVAMGSTPVAYMTCKELDAESIYMQYGGAFPSGRDTALSFRAYSSMIDYLSQNYVRGGTLIENTNTAMLKFAMKKGLLITGVRNFKGSILLEHCIEFGG